MVLPAGAWGKGVARKKSGDRGMTRIAGSGALPAHAHGLRSVGFSSGPCGEGAGFCWGLGLHRKTPGKPGAIYGEDPGHARGYMETPGLAALDPAYALDPIYGG